MDSKSPSKSCPIQRPVYGFLIQRAVNMPKSLMVNGQQAIEQAIQQFAANNHELRQWGEAQNYEMYCVFCGELASQLKWSTVLSQVEAAV